MRIRLFKRLRPYFEGSRRDLLLGYCALPIGSFFDLAVPWIVGRGLDLLQAGGVRMPTIVGMGALMVALTAIKGAFKFSMRWFIVKASRDLERDLRRDLYAHLLTLHQGYFLKQRTGDLMSRLTADIEAVRMLVGPGVMYVAGTLTTVPFAFAILITLNLKLSLLMLVPLIALSAVVTLTSPYIQRHSLAAQAKMGDLTNRAQESFSGIRVIKAFVRQVAEIARFEATGLSYLNTNMDLARARAWGFALIWAVKDLGVLMVLMAGGLDLLTGNFSLGDFFIFNYYLLRLFWPMIAVGWMIGMYHRGAAGMTRLNEIFDARNPSALPRTTVQLARVTGPIEIRDLSFAYNGAPVLHHVSLEIRAGETLGLTGRTGSGKSTLAALLPRLFEPERGCVFVDGVDILDLPIKTLRESIGFVPQDTFLFSRSLRANIALAEPGGADAAVGRALELAHLDHDVRGFERGLDQIVGERGVTLSGGQRQRATLARALLADPPILVLDDCLSAVDSQTEEAILAGLRPALR